MKILAPDTSAHDTSIGGKAAGLRRLLQAGFPVPRWRVILPPDEEAVRALEGQIFSVSEAMLLQKCRETGLHDALQSLLAEEFQGATKFAVRSSAMDEDGTAHSFAGQFQSFLNVRPEEVMLHVVRVWLSGFQDRAAAYRKARHLNAALRCPAVVVQEMVEADAAGVLFTCDPVTGNRDILSISAVRGLGEALVQGTETGEWWRIDSRLTVLEHAPESAAGLSVLTAAEAILLAAEGRRIASHMGYEADIEWARSAAGWHFLQARPITGLPPAFKKSVTLWDNSNIVESYSGITTPLTYSFARQAYEAVYRQFCRIMGVPSSRIERHHAIFEKMIGQIQGRIYYNLNSWYQVLALLPGFRLNRPFMEQMMGVREPIPAEILEEIETMEADRSRRRAWLELVSGFFQLFLNAFTLKKQIRKFHRRVDGLLAESGPDLESMPLEGLAHHYRRMERDFLRQWHVPIINDFLAMIGYGVTRKLLLAWAGEGASSITPSLLASGEHVISTEPARKVEALAVLARDQPGFSGKLHSALGPGTWRDVVATHPVFARALEDYIRLFGDRCLGELKLESATLRDNPERLLRTVVSLSQSGLLKEPKPVPSEKEHLPFLLSGRLRRSVFALVLGWTRSRLANRENLRYERTRVFGLARRVFLTMGRRLHEAGQLENIRDVFFLTREELLDFCDGTLPPPALRDRSRLRKEIFAGYEQQPSPPDRFTTHGADDAVIPSPSPSSPMCGEDRTRKGTGCSPGRVKGRARIILDPAQAELQPGEILVARQTDPGWIQLFPLAAAVIVERGSPLSHASIVSRELGLPAVVGLAGATEWLQTGEWVAVDGREGTVHRLDTPESSF